MESAVSPAMLLAAAVRANSIGAVEEVLYSYPDIDINLPLVRDSFLDMAIMVNSVQIVRKLLEHGANPDGPSMNRPPITNAISRGLLPIVNVLLLAGASLFWDCRRCTSSAMWVAVNSGHPELVSLLVSSGLDPRWRSETSILSLCGVCRYPERAEKILNFLLDYGCDPNAMNATGATILIRFAQMDTESAIVCIKLLLQRGADPNWVDSQKRPAIVYAIALRSFEVVGILLRHGAKLPPSSMLTAEQFSYLQEQYYHIQLERLRAENAALVKQMNILREQLRTSHLGQPQHAWNTSHNSLQLTTCTKKKARQAE